MYKKNVFLVLMLFFMIFSSNSIMPMQTLRRAFGLNLKQEIPKDHIRISKKALKNFPEYRDYFINYALKRCINDEYIDPDEISYLFDEYKFAIEIFTKGILDNWKSFTNSHSYVWSVHILKVILKHDISQLKYFLPKLFFETNIKFLGYFTKGVLYPKDEFDKLVTNEFKLLLKDYSIDSFIIILENDKSFIKNLDLIFNVLERDQKEIIRAYILDNKISNIFPLLTILNLRLYPEHREEYENYLVQNFEYCLSDADFYKDVFMAIIHKNPKIILKLEKKIKDNINIIDVQYLRTIASALCFIGEIDIAAQILLLKDFSYGVRNIDNCLHSLKYDTLNETKDNIQNLLNILKKKILFNPKNVNPNHIDSLWKYFTEEEKNKIKNFYQEDETSNPKFTVLLKNQLPASLYPSQNNQTQSKQHLLMSKQFLGEIDEKIERFILSIYMQEKIEHDNEHYVFYHGRQWTWNFLSDIYKQLWNITRNDNVNDNFHFLRLGLPGPKRDGNYDLLFMNSAIFGNLTNHGSCTFHYWFTNFDQSWNKNLPDLLIEIFKYYNLIHLFNEYKNDLLKLQDLHKQISSHGEILMISIPANKLDNVIPTESGGGIKAIKMNDKSIIGTKIILDAIKNNPKDLNDIDRLEWGLVLGIFRQDSYYSNLYTRDPNKGLNIYSFYLGDENKMEEYKNLRDKIFEKIKQDIKNPKLRSKL